MKGIEKDRLKELVKVTKSLKLLYVEDNENARNQMLKMLKNFFVYIDLATDGEDGLLKFKKNSYDLIITDINMPKMTGLEMSKEILLLDENKYIIVISAYNDTEYLQECIDIGITNYLHKPIKLENLINILEKTTGSLLKQNRIKSLNAQINNLLNNAKDGYLSFGKELKCNNGYSKRCLDIFRVDELQNQDISELLFQNDQKAKALFIDTIQNIYDSNDELQIELFLSLLPTVQIINKKVISIEYKLLKDKSFMLILSDITEQKRLEEKLNFQHKIQNMLVSVASNRDDFLELRDEFLEFLESPPKDVDTLLRLLHTFKGNFAQKEMIYIVDAIHQAEDTIKTTKILDLQVLENLKNIFEKDLFIIRKNFHEDFCSSKDLLKIDPKELQKIEQKLQNIANKHQIIQNSIEEILFYIDKLRHKPLKNMLTNYQKYLENLSKKLQKPIHPLIIDGKKDILIPQKFKPFVKSLVHVFNNALVHGIEEPHIRDQLGKDIYGTISCYFEQIQNNIIIEISDDGAGLDEEKIVKKAIQNNIISKDESKRLKKDDKLKLIFKLHLSTKEQISTTSGRGVGLNSVYEELKKIKAEVVINSKKNQGTTFSFILPIQNNYYENKPLHEALCEPIASQLISLLSQNTKAKLLYIKEIFSTNDLKDLLHSKIDFDDGLGSCTISYTKDILHNLKEIFLLEEDELIFTELPKEITNIIIGLSITEFPEKFSQTSISIPKLISAQEIEDEFNKNNKSHIFKIVTSKGTLYCTLLLDNYVNIIKTKQEKEDIC